MEGGERGEVVRTGRGGREGGKEGGKEGRKEGRKGGRGEGGGKEEERRMEGGKE